MNSNTIAAIATGMNPSGIGIIRISGEDAFNIASSIFRKKNNSILDKFEAYRAHYGYIYDDSLLLDEVILLIFKAPYSFTGEDVVEIQCHGGIIMMKNILELCIKKGAKLAEPGEFTKRAFLNGRIDLSKAEAVIDVISSKNELSLKNSVKQMTGSLYNSIKEIRDTIIYEIAYIESALDDPEHISLDGYSSNLYNKLSEILDKLCKLSDSFNDGKVIKEGVNTVILGKPNVGKSSLLNLLAGDERAIVTDIAGTTRDTILESIYINGILLNIADTAGIRESNDIVEQMGVKKALNIAENADFIIFVLDSSDALSYEDEEIFSFIKKHNKKCVILLNKSDLDSVIGVEEINCITSYPVINISVKDNIGINELKNFITDEFTRGMIKYNDELFISNIRHRDLINSAVSSLLLVKKSIEDEMPEDFYSIDLTSAYDFLGQIIGEQIDEDLVNEIFSKFCMGK